MDKNIIHVDKTEYENLIKEIESYREDGKSIIVHIEHQEMYGYHRTVRVHSSVGFKEYLDKVLAPLEELNYYKDRVKKLVKKHLELGEGLMSIKKELDDIKNKKWWK